MNQKKRYNNLTDISPETVRQDWYCPCLITPVIFDDLALKEFFRA